METTQPLIIPSDASDASESPITNFSQTDDNLVQMDSKNEESGATAAVMSAQHAVKVCTLKCI